MEIFFFWGCLYYVHIIFRKKCSRRGMGFYIFNDHFTTFCLEKEIAVPRITFLHHWHTAFKRKLLRRVMGFNKSIAPKFRAFIQIK